MQDQLISPFLTSLRSVFGHQQLEGHEPTNDELTELIIRLIARDTRNAIRSGPYSGPIGSKSRRVADQFARRVSRAKLKKLRRELSIERPKKLGMDLLLMRFARSPILDRLVSDREKRWRPLLRRIVGPRSPELRLQNFSFLTHPQETLQAFKAIGELELTESSAHLHFDDEFCLDAGAYLVLAEIWHSVRHALVGGKMERPVQKVLAATGVGEHNRMKLLSIGHGRDDDQADVWAFTLQRRRAARTSKSPTVHLEPQTREKTADQFCDKIDEWLGVPDIEQELTLEGRGWIAQIIGELLCNAERHSQLESNDGDWSTTAFMVRREEGGVPSLRCHIAFLSVGRSIAESLLDAAPDIRSLMNAYVDRHKASGISSATLSTVFALQDTITRDPEARELRSGGTGLQDVLDFVNLLGGTALHGKEPQVAVISGSSCVQMRPPYIQGKRDGNESAPRVLWFNAANSSEDGPDGRFVMDLQDHFAGTLVSVAFTLDPAYLAAQSESDDENDQS